MKLVLTYWLAIVACAIAMLVLTPIPAHAEEYDPATGTASQNCRWEFPDMGAGGGYEVWVCEDWTINVSAPRLPANPPPPPPPADPTPTEPIGTGNGANTGGGGAPIDLAANNKQDIKQLCKAKDPKNAIYATTTSRADWPDLVAAATAIVNENRDLQRAIQDAKGSFRFTVTFSDGGTMDFKTTLGRVEQADNANPKYGDGVATGCPA